MSRRSKAAFSLLPSAHLLKPAPLAAPRLQPPTPAAPAPAPAPSGPKAAPGLPGLPGLGSLFAGKPVAAGQLYSALGPAIPALARYTGGLGLYALNDMLVRGGRNIGAFRPRP